MLTEQDKTFFDDLIELDDKLFIRCKFTNCTLRYKGGQTEWDKDTVFIGCRWEFLGTAERTVKVHNLAATDPLNFHWSNVAFRNF